MRCILILKELHDGEDDNEMSERAKLCVEEERKY